MSLTKEDVKRIAEAVAEEFQRALDVIVEKQQRAFSANEAANDRWLALATQPRTLPPLDRTCVVPQRQSLMCRLRNRASVALRRLAALVQGEAR